MNLFKAIYCYHYDVSKTPEKHFAVRKNANIASAVALVLLFASFYLLRLRFFPNFDSSIRSFLNTIISSYGTNITGKISGLLIFGIAYSFIYFYLGTPKAFKKTIDEYTNLSKPEQEAISRRGNYFFKGTIILFFVGVLLFST